MSAKPFFILSLPRSRSAWLSAFMTTGSSICHHEIGADIQEVSDLKWYLGDPRYSHVGFCDTALAIWWRDIIEEFPRAPKVVIRRDPEQVVNSLRSMPLFSRVNRDDLLDRLEQIEEGLEELSELPETRVIAYESLAFSGISRVIMEHLTPEVPFDKVRWALLDRLNIQCDMGKLVSRVRSTGPQGLVTKLAMKELKPCH